MASTVLYVGTPQERTSSQAYDDHGRVLQRQLPSVDGFTPHRSASYDVLGRVVSASLHDGLVGGGVN